MQQTKERIDFLRRKMKDLGICAYIIPSSDPHLSEYVANHWKFRKWSSGFTGSAGTLVITQNDAGLWTDSRYFLQAENQLIGTGITLFKEGLSDTPSYVDWLCKELQENNQIGLNGALFSTADFLSMKDSFSKQKINLRYDIDLSSDCELDELPCSQVFILDKEVAGKSIEEKKEAIFKNITGDFLLISALDEIAWTFNIRASDIPYNPVTISYALLGKSESYLFIEESKISSEVKNYLSFHNIQLLPYNEIISYLKNISGNVLISLDTKSINYLLYKSLNSKSKIIESSPISVLKAIKNETEIDGIKRAMIKDGVALTEAFSSVEKRILSGDCITELDISKILLEYRSKQTDFFCESFSTIAGYGAHGAIVHYTANQESNIQVCKNGNLLLVDSGGNYLHGTTDITRTFIYGNPTPEQKKDYTLVLKGHIGIASAKFPKGTQGYQLDVLAKQFLWQNALTYGHGTGHGIGHFLCVHEGPQNIRISGNGTTLEPGMVLSNEPGVYKENRHGIRLENVITVVNDLVSEFGNFYKFETLTLFPFEEKLIEKDLLSKTEIDWINNYHQQVFEKLSSHIQKEEDLVWLKNKTKPLD